MWICKFSDKKIIVKAKNPAAAVRKTLIYFEKDNSIHISDSDFYTLLSRIGLSKSEVNKLRRKYIFEDFVYNDYLETNYLTKYITQTPRGDYYKIKNLYFSEDAVDLMILYDIFVYVEYFNVPIVDVPLKVNITKELL